jgi:hypothetical protein
MIAAEYAREDTVQLMLDLGMDINARDYKGEVCLHDAVRSGIVDVVQLLLRNGAKVDVIDKYGRTPLRAVLDEPPTLFERARGLSSSCYSMKAQAWIQRMRTARCHSQLPSAKARSS